jgi:hypothetical protein
MPTTTAANSNGKRKLKSQKVENSPHFHRTIWGLTLFAPDARNARTCNAKVKAIQEISIPETLEFLELLFFIAVKSGTMATIANGLDSPETIKTVIEAFLNLTKNFGQTEITEVRIKSCHLALPKFPILLSLADGTNTTIALPSSASSELFVRMRSTANTVTPVRTQIKVVMSDAKIAVYASENGAVEIASSRGSIEMYPSQELYENTFQKLACLASSNM